MNFSLRVIFRFFGRQAELTNSSLNRDEQEIQKRAWERVRLDLEGLISCYLIDNGNILDADRAKELFPEYAATLETRCKNASAVYEPAQQVVDAIFLRIVQSKNARGKVVIFTAGGPGAGKSALLNSIGDKLDDVAVIMDGTLSDWGRASANVKLALDNQMQVAIYYIHRKFDDAIDGVIDRALSPTSGRSVPMRIVANKHYGAMHSIQEFARKFKDDGRVLIEVRKFIARECELQPCGLGEVIRATPKSLDAFIKRAYALLNARYAKAKQNGESFPKEVYERLASQSPSFKSPHR